jgi:hypothetical protein
VKSVVATELVELFQVAEVIRSPSPLYVYDSASGCAEVLLEEVAEVDRGNDRPAVKGQHRPASNDSDVGFGGVDGGTIRSTFATGIGPLVPHGPRWNQSQ